MNMIAIKDTAGNVVGWRKPVTMEEILAASTGTAEEVIQRSPAPAPTPSPVPVKAYVPQGFGPVAPFEPTVIVPQAQPALMQFIVAVSGEKGVVLEYIRANDDGNGVTAKDIATAKNFTSATGRWYCRALAEAGLIEQVSVADRTGEIRWRVKAQPARASAPANESDAVASEGVEPAAETEAETPVVPEQEQIPIETQVQGGQEVEQTEVTAAEVAEPVQEAVVADGDNVQFIVGDSGERAACIDMACTMQAPEPGSAGVDEGVDASAHALSQDSLVEPEPVEQGPTPDELRQMREEEAREIAARYEAISDVLIAIGQEKQNLYKEYQGKCEQMRDTVTPLADRDQSIVSRLRVNRISKESVVNEIKRAMKAVGELQVNYGNGYSEDAFRFRDGEISMYQHRRRLWETAYLDKLFKYKDDIAAAIRDTGLRAGFEGFVKFVYENRDQIRDDRQSIEEPTVYFARKRSIYVPRSDGLIKVNDVVGIRIRVPLYSDPVVSLIDDTGESAFSADISRCVVEQLRPELERLIDERNALLKNQNNILEQIMEHADKHMGTWLALRAL